MNRIFSDCLHLDPDRFPLDELRALDDAQWERLIDMVAGHRVTVIFHNRLGRALAREQKAKSREQKTKSREQKAKFREQKAKRSREQHAPTAEGAGPARQDRIHPEPVQDESVQAEPIQDEPFLRATEKLQQFSRHLTKINLQKQHDLLTILRRFESAGIPVILLKGAWLTHAVYEAPGLREMADLDLMVRVEDLEQAVAALRELGYKTGRDLKDLDVEIQRKHHLPSFRREGAIMVELHWNITHEGRDDFVPPDELWERSREVRVGGARARTLSPEDMLLHLCLHITYQHMFLPGIRPVLDVALFVKFFGVDAAGATKATGAEGTSGDTEPSVIPDTSGGSVKSGDTDTSGSAERSGSADTSAETGTSGDTEPTGGADLSGSAGPSGADKIDWHVLTRQAIAYDWHRGVWLTLRMARDLFGAPVPDDALRRMEDAWVAQDEDADTARAETARMETADAESARADTARAETARAEIVGEETAAARPDDLDATVRTAAEQMLTLYFRRNVTQHQVTNLMNKKGIAGKTRHILGRLFPPRKRIAQIYILPHNSPKVWLLYPAYIAKLLWRSLLYSKNMMEKEEGVDGQVTRRERLRLFLEGG